MASGFSWTPKRVAFCEEYLVDMNGAAAARRAGFSERTARDSAAELMRKPEILARLAALQAARSERTQITADDVLRELWTLAKADPRELVTFYVGACRYCHGVSHQYQHTAAERETNYAAWKKEQDLLATAPRGRRRDTTVTGEFDELGGIGYDRTRPPHPTCPECNGLGAGYMVVKDQRHASAPAVRLLAGVKETREGISVQMHDPVTAIVHVGRHLGMFKEVVEHRDVTLEDLIRDAAGEVPDAGDA